MTVLAPCVSCGHGADEHRLHGDRIPEMPKTATVEEADVVRGDLPRAILGPFLCTAAGCGCPDYVDEPLVRKKRP